MWKEREEEAKKARKIRGEIKENRERGEGEILTCIRSRMSKVCRGLTMKGNPMLLIQSVIVGTGSTQTNSQINDTNQTYDED